MTFCLAAWIQVGGMSVISRLVWSMRMACDGSLLMYGRKVNWESCRLKAFPLDRRTGDDAITEVILADTRTSITKTKIAAVENNQGASRCAFICTSHDS